MTGFYPEGLAGTIATWLAALVTILVFSYLLGERRIFRLAQHLLAGLATGYLVLLAVREVLIPRLVEPIGSGSANPFLWVAAVLVLVMAGAVWLPRSVVAVPVAVLMAATAAFALGGAVAGTLMPQLGAALLPPRLAVPELIGSVVSLVITVLVLLAFLHGSPRRRVVVGAAGAGRWLLLGGIGGWLGFLLVSRLSLLVDRMGFLLNGWLGIGR
jgi:hypothetical protein